MSLLQPISSATRLRSAASRWTPVLLLCSLLGLAAIKPASAATPFIEVLKGATAGSEVQVRDIKVDDLGFSYVSGYLKGQVDFGLGQPLIGSGPFNTCFIGKRNPAGVWQWVKTLGTSDIASVSRVNIGRKGVAVAVSQLRKPLPAPVGATFSRVFYLDSITGNVVVSYTLDSAQMVAVDAVALQFVDNEEFVLFGGNYSDRLSVTHDQTGAAQNPVLAFPGSPGTGDTDLFFFRASTRSLLWGVRGGSSGFSFSSDRLASIVVDAANHIYVGGTIAGRSDQGRNNPGQLFNADAQNTTGTVYTGIVRGKAGVAVGNPEWFVGSLNLSGSWLAWVTDNGTTPRSSDVNVPNSESACVDMVLAGGKLYLGGNYVPVQPVDTLNGFVVAISPGKLLGGGYTPAAIDPIGIEIESTTRILGLAGNSQAVFALARVGRGANVVSFSAGARNSGAQYQFSGVSSFNPLLLKLTPGLGFVTNQTTTDPNRFELPDNMGSEAIAWDESRSRVIWGGYFRDTARALRLGTAPDTVTLPPSADTSSFLAHLDANLRHLSAIKLQVNSAFGPISLRNGEQTSILTSGTSYSVVIDQTGEISVPETIYLDASGALLPKEQSQLGVTRRRCVGFDIPGTSISGKVSSYVISNRIDFAIRFNWVTEHLLRIVNDLTGTDLTSPAAGNPEPPQGANWVEEGKFVNAFIDGVAADGSTTGTRSVVSEIVTTGFTNALIQPKIGLRWEIWNGIGGNSVDALRQSPAFPNQPSELRFLQETDSLSTPRDAAENYGQRIRGVLRAPATGTYSFDITSDDASEFWFDLDGSGLKKLAGVASFTAFDNWDADPSQHCGPFSLVAGGLYPMEILHKEGIGQDHLKVRWRRPNPPALDPLLETPVPAKYFLLPDLNGTMTFGSVQARQQVPQFVMSRPASITYKWKVQHRIQISTVQESTISFPLIHDYSANADLRGSGEFWVDHGHQVGISARYQDPSLNLTLSGWLNGNGAISPIVFESAANPANPWGSLTNVNRGTETYKEFFVPALLEPARITWNYGDTVIDKEAPLGSSFSARELFGDPDYEVRSVTIVDAPTGSGIADVQIWDRVAKRILPLRPAIFLLEWTKINPADLGKPFRRIVRVVSGIPGSRIPVYRPGATGVFPGSIPYRHIAGTPPVDLDPPGTTNQYFLGMKYTSGDAAVTTDHHFSSPNPSVSVLLFSTSSGALQAVGDLNRESLRVAMVESRTWSGATNDWSNLGRTMLRTNAVDQEVGTPLSSAFDTAALGTGYLISERANAMPLANYDAEIYQPGIPEGPIIPVNVRAPENYENLIVVWYERQDGILWPYQPEVFQRFIWPARPTGAPTRLKRIVIASRLGSEGKDQVGNDQVVFSADRYEQVKIYQQPDPSRPGYNPNEEHALIAPSFGSRSDPNPPPTAYALRNDLNITTNLIASLKKPGGTELQFSASDYTSDPFVLVQYFDRTINQYRMAVYEVQRTDATVDDARILEPPLADRNAGAAELLNRRNYLFQYPVRAGERVLPFYPLDVVSGLSACLNTATYDFVAIEPNGSFFKDNQTQRTTWADHQGNSWAVSGDSYFYAYYYYPLRSDFWYPSFANFKDQAARSKAVGECIPWLPRFDLGAAAKAYGVYDPAAPTRLTPEPVQFQTFWPDTIPTLKVGETLTHAGGEYAHDFPETPGLPGVVSWASGEVVFDSQNPRLQSTAQPSANPIPDLTVRAATTRPLDGTYAANDSGGRWTAKAVGKLSLDGVDLAANDLVLVWREAQSPERNGIYSVSDPGGSATAWSLNRVTNSSVFVPRNGFIVRASAGISWGNARFQLEAPAAVEIGKTALTFGPITPETLEARTSFSARLVAPLPERVVPLPKEQLPSYFLPASGHVTIQGDRLRLDALPPSLRKRLFISLTGKTNAASPAGLLGITGYLNDKTLGDPDLTAAPPPVYLLEPNILTLKERALLLGIDPASPFADIPEVRNSQAWKDAVNALYTLTRNPNGLTGPEGYLAGLEPAIKRDARGRKQYVDPSTKLIPARLPNVPVSASVVGPGLALVPNPALLDPSLQDPLNRTVPWSVAYLTLAENNDETLGVAPITLHVVRIDKNFRYRGAIKTVYSENVFDEKVTLRHSGDFGGNVDDLAFNWWYRAEDGQSVSALPPEQPWLSFGTALGLPGQVSIDLVGGTPQLLTDNLFFVRYRHVKDVPSDASWTNTQWFSIEGYRAGQPPTPKGGAWAGAANSPDENGNYRPQLSAGWVKRVTDSVNPYEARVQDFSTGDSPATYASMIEQAGRQYQGPVALNAAKNVLENVGLIELYTTVLDRAKALSIDRASPVTGPAINNAILLAMTRISDFYMLLGNEAYTDAQDPTIGYGSDGSADLSGASPGYGSLAPTVFCFQNQLPSLLEEELALLRGTDHNRGYPVYNRLFWNFTKGEGEAAYALSYHVTDVNNDGFINELDAQRMYPQGHGDAWGYYLSALRARYDLLRNPNFNWTPRAEFYNLLDVTLDVDFLDERKFAAAAAARAQAGVEIVNLTYRQKYVENPDGQWQGYADSDPSRAWGVTDWARRAGQGAYFDWVTANAILPSSDPSNPLQGLQRVDRGTVTELSQLSAHLGSIQMTCDTSDGGLNPLGLDPDVVPFDLDPTFLDVGSTAAIGRPPIQNTTHYEQIYERAIAALGNAMTAFNNANEAKNLLRQTAHSSEELRQTAVEQDLDYRNRLIEIFGMPYLGTMGPGKPYPAGFKGPDLMLYMYADLQSVNSSSVPAAGDAYSVTIATFDDFKKAQGTLSGGFSSYFLNDLTQTMSTATQVDTWFGTDKVLKLNLPPIASSYAFQAPTTWGSRPSTGRLQGTLNEMLQAQADLALGVSDYGLLVAQIRDAVELVKAKRETYASVLDRKHIIADAVAAANAAAIVAEIAARGFRGLESDIDNLLTASVEILPKSTGTSFDPSFVARGTLAFAKKAATVPIQIALHVAEQAVSVADRSAELTQIFGEIEHDQDLFGLEIRQDLTELKQMLLREGTTRIEVFRRREQLRQLGDQYRSTLQEGVRLIEERRNFNVRVASATQRSRYQDMTFRISRNDALQKYQASFALAARYAYMAGKAYDYETNLSPDDRGSASGPLADIIKARTLGQMVDGQPMHRGGLAGALAALNENWKSLEGRLGANNFQMEKHEFSLRNELFRLLTPEQPDPANRDPLETRDAWLARETLRLGYGTNAPGQTTLRPDYGALQSTIEAADDAFRNELRKASIHKPDLWAIPEFRRYCRPFAAHDPAVKEPGLVIDFETMVLAGKNLFGWPLSGGDSSYDPSNFATKIRSLTVRFEGYDAGAMSKTPRVYLIPVGIDRMTLPLSRKAELRDWNIVDQIIPVPWKTGASDLQDPDWIPVKDSLQGSNAEIRRYSSFLANIGDVDDLVYDTRVVGRSIWNTRWLLIIPGRTFLADPEAGLETLLNSITDIHLSFETYAYSGN